MKLLIIIPCILFFFTGNAIDRKKNYFETTSKNDSIVAVYHFKNDVQNELIVLELYRNNTYAFSVHGNHYDFYSKGTWQKNKRTIVVNSFVQKKEIPITITQSYTKSNSPYIQIEDIKNSTSFLFKDIEVLTNYDSSKSCYANVGSNCKLKKQDVKSIQIRLIGNTTSAWHPITFADNNNTLKIAVDIDFIPEFYVFFENKVFKKKGRKLYDPDLEVYYKKGRLKSEKVKK